MPAESRLAPSAASAAHARLLEERPTGSSGEEFPLVHVLEVLSCGQFVNCALAQPSGDAETEGAAGSTHLPPGEVTRPSERWASEVLDVQPRRGVVILGLQREQGGIERGRAVVLDLTDVTGTYYVYGTVDELRGDGRSLVIRCQRAVRLQLRRFVRVPALISPRVMEVERVPGEWHPVSGEIVDVSLGGIGLLVAEPLAAGAQVHVVFELPGRFGALSVYGRIVAPPGPAEAHATVRMAGRLAHRRGVAFAPLDVDDLRRLQRALYHRQVELRRLSDGPLERRAPVDAELPSPQPSPAAQRPRWHFWRKS